MTATDLDKLQNGTTYCFEHEVSHIMRSRIDFALERQYMAELTRKWDTIMIAGDDHDCHFILL